MNIIVTGGYGFIGSHFIKYIRKVHPSWDIFNVDKLTYAGNIKNLGSIKCKSYIQDIADEDGMEIVFSEVRPNIVVNFAAQSIAEDVHVPVKSSIGTRVSTFKEFWKQQSKQKKIEDDGFNQIIHFENKNVKILSYLNGGQWMPIKYLIRHKYRGKITSLRQKWGSIKTTPNHSIYSSNLQLTTPENNPELLVVRTINENKRKYHSKSDYLLRIIAAYVSEGATFKNKANGSYVTSISQKSREWLENIKDCIEKEFNLSNISIKLKQDGTNELIVLNKSLYSFLRKNCSYGSSNKKFPNWVFDLPKNQKVRFVKYLQDGDGCIVSGHNNYTTTSEYLANQLCLLLSLIGLNFKVNERLSDKDEWNTAYIIEINKSNHIGLCEKTKEEIDYDGWVYDIEVDKTHNFVCGLGNVVCHNTHVDRSIRNPKEFIDTDISGVFNLMRASRHYGVEKFIHISTDEVYGPIEMKVGEAREDWPLNPTSPYAASKASGDLLLLSYFKTYNFPVIIARPCNNYGPNQYPEKLIPMIITRLLNNKKILLHGEGKEIREWIHVEDCVRAIDKIMTDGKLGEIYNIGSGDRKTNVEIVDSTLWGTLYNFEDMHNSWQDKLKQHIEHVPNRPGNDFRYAINSNKIKKLYDENYLKTRFHGPYGGLRETIKWYKNNQGWYRGVDLDANLYQDGEYLR